MDNYNYHYNGSSNRKPKGEGGENRVNSFIQKLSESSSLEDIKEGDLNAGTTSGADGRDRWSATNQRRQPSYPEDTMQFRSRLRSKSANAPLNSSPAGQHLPPQSYQRSGSNQQGQAARPLRPASNQSRPNSNPSSVPQGAQGSYRNPSSAPQGAQSSNRNAPSAPQGAQSPFRNASSAPQGAQSQNRNAPISPPSSQPRYNNAQIAYPDRQSQNSRFRDGSDPTQYGRSRSEYTAAQGSAGVHRKDFNGNTNRKFFGEIQNNGYDYPYNKSENDYDDLDEYSYDDAPEDDYDDKNGGKTRKGKSPKDKPSKGKKKKRGKVVWWKRFLKVCLYLIGIFAVLFCVLAVVTAIYLNDVTQNDESLLDLNALKLSFATRLMYFDPDSGEEGTWVEYQRIYADENRVWINFDAMPTYLKDSIIASEDHGFMTHKGIDVKRTIAATLNMLLESVGIDGFLPTSQGGSTLTQQLIKNITDEKESSGFDGIKRKVREIYRAYQLERRFTKDQILEAYLNTFRLGGQVAGIEAGATYYFGKTTQELTPAECAAIVSITKNPSANDPFLHPEQNKSQRDYVLLEMHDLGTLGDAEYEQAQAESNGFEFEAPYGSTQMARHEVYSYFTDTAVVSVLADLTKMYENAGYDQKYESASDAAYDIFFNGGLEVRLTMDIKVQEAVEDVAVYGPVQSGSYLEGINEEEAAETGQKATQYHDRKPIMEDIPKEELELDENGDPIYELDEDGEPIKKRLAKNQVQDAIVVMNFKGELMGIAGGIYKKESSLGLNRAVGSIRQTGSSMKPLGAYCLPLEHDFITFSTGFKDAPTEVINGQPWPRNYDFQYDPGLVSVAEAVERSLNTVAVQSLKKVGVDMTYDFLTMVGITSLSDPEDRALGPLSLGSMTYGISPYEMTAAYAMFGNDGQFYEKHCYSEVRDSYGSVLLDNSTVAGTRAISPQTAMIMNRLLQGVCLRGTATNARPNGSNNPNNLPYAGKTGTTSENKDYWFIGMNPYYVCAIWEGYDEPEYLSSPFSVKPIQKMFRTIMARISADKPYIEFPTAEGVITEKYCRDTGDLASPACTDVQTGYYKAGHLPKVCQHEFIDLINEPTEDENAAA